MEAYDVIIIGAGLSGLAAGIRLSQYGKHVLIVERQHYAGGMNSYYRRGDRCYDVGLHAMTNLADPSNHSAPLNTLLRQLKVRRDELKLCPQQHSCVKFPDATLCFDNDFETLRSSVREISPQSADGFDRLCQAIRDDDAFNPSLGYLSSRQVVASYIDDARLCDMLLCPVMFYGSSWLDDMDFHQFCVVFRSIFFEGLSRPADGMAPFIDVFTRRTMALLSSPTDKPPARGELAYTETLFELDVPAAQLGMTESIAFTNSSERFSYCPPTEGSTDLRSCVLCVPGNFSGVHETEGVAVVRMSHLASYDYWKRLDKKDYRDEKERVMDRQQAILERTSAGFNAHVTRREMFTPLTLERYTGRVGGSIYGSPEKRKDCRTAVPNLFVCGSDQGYLGIVGSLLSGVVVANRYLLR